VRVPGIAYWKGTIKPGRVSAGLFELTDLYATSLALAGASDKVPGDRYIDSIDQSSLLLTDDGASRRRAIYYWEGNAFMGVRVAEFKFLVKEQAYQPRAFIISMYAQKRMKREYETNENNL
jgi:arylsulfatase